MIRVLIVDDRRSVRVGLRALFDSQPDIGVCGLASSGEAGLVLAATLDPDVVVMDLVMPGMGGVAATRAIMDSRAECRVLVLSGQWSCDQVEPALRAGASRFVHKSERPEMLLEAVRALGSEGQDLVCGTVLAPRTTQGPGVRVRMSVSNERRHPGRP